MWTMRADRLVATLLVLQAKGRVTASEVADELEVSVKTARRDLVALAIAGSRCTAGRPRRRLVAARRRPHRPQRTDCGGGPHAVHGRRPVLHGHAGGEGGAPQAGPGVARDVPCRCRGGGRRRRARSRRLGRAPAPTPRPSRRAAAGGDRRRPGAARLRRPPAHRDRAHRPPARPRREGLGLVPRRRHRRRPAHVPAQPGSLDRCGPATRSRARTASTSRPRGSRSSPRSRSGER